MKRIYYILMLLFLAGGMVGAEKPTLKFHSDGTFKIIQLTDMHIRSFNPEQEAEVHAGIKWLAKVEKPDLFVLTGDNVTVNPAEPAITRLTSILDSTGVAWIAVLGNHDEQQNLTKGEMAKLYVSGVHSLNTLNDAGEIADVQMAVQSADGKKDAFFVFCMDSHSYTDVLGEECYDWFTQEQVQWLRDCCTARTSSDGTVAPSLAFFHIPLCEYIDAWASRDNPREDAASPKQSTGIRGENICCGGVNSGMFNAMRETGSVMGVSVGHDHDNDFIAIYRNIALCYGRFSGSNTVYNHLPHGVRVFVVREGIKGFETWIREYEGRVIDHLLFDGNELKKAPRDRKTPYGIWSKIEQPK